MNSSRPAPVLPGGGPEDAWYDENAGPVVRLYAMTGGRAHPGDHGFTVSTLVQRTEERAPLSKLSPEESAILRLCARALSVAEIAAYLTLPLGTVQVLLGDLRDAGLVRVPQQPEEDHLSLAVMQRLHEGLLAL
ncbi:DUF742 domain-containing protein [Couchioplanes caeruleus]|uniref:DUF742 domain-containing protein n=1 Tax=Couchioplanes caeruleus TaxID=56438 RepID=UPI0020BFCD27|nr:DUF742 domain-containing protein [Couchioplanes caeruleus]UQU61939.1 DUF742 domain-containing protein [Couchioplanes caeruleus]